MALPVRAAHLYTYAVPDALREHVAPGVTVRVPHGRAGGLIQGLCVRVAEGPWDHTFKLIADVERRGPLLSEPLLELGLWISEYYACPPGLTLTSWMPAAARRARAARVTMLRMSGRESPADLTPKQRALLASLAQGPRARVEVLRAAGVGAAVAAGLMKRGLVEAFQTERTASRSGRETSAAPSEPRAACPEDSYTLTASQQAALAEIASATDTPDLFRVFLLFGVPGSGKTEVYVRAMRRVVARGRQAILLVPEIALATQIVQRLARRFERVAVWHGRLAAGVRGATWRTIAAGEVDVVIGTRSALVAPCPRLGLIVVDEEQDTSFKNLAAPHYHARDVAIKRAQLEQIPCVLGSATPALETWHNAHTLGHYRLLRLTERVAGARRPEVRPVETRSRELGQTTGVLSEELRQRLTETLAAGQQTILLHNRRGYAVFLRCGTCRMVVACVRCGARLVYHQTDRTVRCHRCGVREPAPTTCLDTTCGGRLERLGQAIQRLEEELVRVVPQARLLRLDRDTMRRRDDYARALERFEAGEADILLGTQMVAKGLDFPRVRLVGVIDAGAALSLPDFRAAEHVFQLIVQVIGRAGRREGAALALVQSEDVAVPAIRHALRMDYEAFAEQELAARRRFFYPPFARLVRLILADARPGRAREEAERLAEASRPLAARVHPQIRVHDGCPCVVARLRQMARYEVVLRGPRDASLQQLLREARTAKLLSPRVQRFTIDVDPVDLL